MEAMAVSARFAGVSHSSSIASQAHDLASASLCRLDLSTHWLAGSCRPDAEACNFTLGSSFSSSRRWRNSRIEIPEQVGPTRRASISAGLPIGSDAEVASLGYHGVAQLSKLRHRKTACSAAGQHSESRSTYSEIASGSREAESDNPMVKRLQQRGMKEGLEDSDRLREECGVVGIFGDPDASRMAYLALHALQHRGQEGAGIVTSGSGRMRTITGMGLVSEVFDQSKLKELEGTSAIGHVRYATAGESVLKNVQPFVAGYRFGPVAVAHNGNLINYEELHSMLEEKGSIFNTSSDTEVILHLIAMSAARPFLARLVNACEQLEGAYSLVFLTDDKLFAVRDPHGFRPLVLGRMENGAVVVSSETCALDLIGATYEREVNPGEVLVVDKNGVSSMCLMPQRQRKACIFEHIYFALPNSIVFGRSVYQSRYRFGQILAEESLVECDVVIAVPDSGVVAALGYAAQAGVPFQQGLIRSHYVGRTFIEPSQKIRDFGVKLKLAPVKPVLEGKRVVVVDDSIVRGTTSSKIVRLIREAGATEVHMRIASPPMIGSCYYGVDTPSRKELISYRLSIEETREYICADSLAFLPLDKLRGMLGEEAPTFCDACLSGEYPVPPPGEAAEKLLTGGRLLDEQSLIGTVEAPVPADSDVPVVV